MEIQELKPILEAMIMASSQPLNLDRLMGLFPEETRPERKAVREALGALAEDYEGRSIELKEVASGWRFQVRKDYADWVTRLWEERPPRYSRALLETLALIAYKQPITRAEIEKVRGVTVSTQIMKTLQEREWIQVVGHRDVPGKPALYATTKGFLDYFNLTSLEDLPPLAEIRDIDQINAELNLDGEYAGETETAGADEDQDDSGVVSLGVEESADEMQADSAEQEQTGDSSRREAVSAEN
jgi:segregation and condensation protein B